MSSMGAASGAIRTIRSVFRGLTRVTSGERWAPSHSGTIALETWPELAELPAVQLILHPGHGYIMGILTWVILICIWYVYMWMFTFHTFLICWLNDLLYDLLCISVSHCVTMSPRTAAWQAANANLVDLTPDASSMTSSSSSRGAGILTSRAPNEVYRPRHRARCSGRFRPAKFAFTVSLSLPANENTNQKPW